MYVLPLSGIIPSSLTSKQIQYYNRWANHEQSAKLSLDLYAKMEQKMEDMQITSSLTWIEVRRPPLFIFMTSVTHTIPL